MSADLAVRLTAALADRYAVERELGAGGMATVYLAEDLKHKRKVALKVLKPELAAVLGAERFVQEITTTAALQHPHILPLFDSGTADGFLYYVMPFINGETLRDKLNRETQLGVDEAVKLASEVADALHYAHTQGVIHRDIKPENILLANGRPMVADFGIALAVSAAAGGRMTETGLSLGTPHYMSPEQATAEKEITARSDVYSLGSVLYEMLTGNPPHVGASAQQIIMKIVTDEARPVMELRKSVPPNIAAALAKALEKLPADRFESARAFAEALGNPAFAIASTVGGAHPSAATGWRRHAGAIIAALSLIAIASSTMAVRSRRGTAPAAVTRLNLALPETQGLVATGGTRFAWAPDGRAFVYVGPGTGGSQLWLRSLDVLEATPLQGTDGATSPFFSPDGGQIGFVTLNPFSIRLVPRTGGNTVTLVRDSVSGGGGAWSADGFIYFDGRTTISRIRPDGTGREVVYPLDTLQGEIGAAWPEVLPEGRGVLFRLRRSGEDLSGYRIMVADSRTGKGKVVAQAAFARYAPTGHLLYVTADGALMASRFDLDRLELTGSPVLLGRGLGFGIFGVADLALASTGSLLYAPDYNPETAEPVWVARDGTETSVATPWPEKGQVLSVALSPDGSQLAAQLSTATSKGFPDIWVKHLNGGPLSRLTFESTRNRRPSWSHDGRDVLFLSDRSGTFALYRQRADGSAPARLVASRSRGLGEGFESPDGRWLVLRSEDAVCCDILGLRPGVDSVPVPLLATPFRERSPALSPDGRWLAYASDETGRFEIYVRPFPEVQAGKWQVSSAGGSSPRWSPRGDELFYLDGASAMTAVRVAGRPTFAVLGEQRLFPATGYLSSPWAQTYDVSSDGRRFLMLRVGSSTGAVSVPLVMVENFLTELQLKVPR